MSGIVLKSMRIYPIKACGGIEVAEAQMEERGFQYDRRWMLMNDAGTYFDQLDHLLRIVRDYGEEGGVVSAASPDF